MCQRHRSTTYMRPIVTDGVAWSVCRSVWLWGPERIQYKICITGIQSSAWHGTTVSWTFCPCSWSSQLTGSTVSKQQSLDGPDLQAFRGRWSDLSGFWIVDVERVAQRRCNGAITASTLPALTEDTPLPAVIIIPIFWWFITSVDTCNGPRSDAIT